MNKKTKDNKKSGQPSGEISNDLRVELLAEYSSLRNEILKRMEIRNYLLTFSLIVANSYTAF